VVPAALTRRVIVNRTAETVVRLLPPLVITEAEADEALDRLDAALGAVGQDGDRNA
jgi:acetylornithine/succinyldiaminopimelate/putrescine aminotransferase